MDDFTTFIENFALEDSLYWVVPGHEEHSQFELYWLKKNRLAQWNLRKKGAKEWHVSASDHLTELLNKHEVDIETTKRVVGASIITQAVYASLVVEAAEKLFGSETLQKAFADTNMFLSNLAKKVDESTNADANSPKLKVISNEGS